MGRYRESEDNRLDDIDKEEDEYEETEDEEKREKDIQGYMKKRGSSKPLEPRSTARFNTTKPSSRIW